MDCVCALVFILVAGKKNSLSLDEGREGRREGGREGGRKVERIPHSLLSFIHVSRTRLTHTEPQRLRPRPLLPNRQEDDAPFLPPSLPPSLLLLRLHFHCFDHTRELDARPPALRSSSSSSSSSSSNDDGPGTGTERGRGEGEREGRKA